MGNIGSGSGSSYPGTLDTQTAVEVDSPAAGKTKARAAVPNDLAAAVLAVETTLGTDPQGTRADVKTYLQTEHKADGTHSAITGVTSLNTFPISATPGASTIPVSNATKDLLDRNSVALFGITVANESGNVSTSLATPASVTLASVTAGDVLLIAAQGVWTSSTSGVHIMGTNYSGTATMTMPGSATTATYLNSQNYAAAGSVVMYHGVCAHAFVTAPGNLTITWGDNTHAGTPTSVIYRLSVMFLKKQ